MTAIAILTIAGVLLVFAETLAMCGAGAFFVFRVLAKPILRGIGGRRSIAACAVRPFWAVADF